jgi:hypothetical protein
LLQPCCSLLRYKMLSNLLRKETIVPCHQPKYAWLIFCLLRVSKAQGIQSRGEKKAHIVFGPISLSTSLSTATPPLSSWHDSETCSIFQQHNEGEKFFFFDSLEGIERRFYGLEFFPEDKQYWYNLAMREADVFRLLCEDPYVFLDDNGIWFKSKPRTLGGDATTEVVETSSCSNWDLNLRANPMAMVTPNRSYSKHHYSDEELEILRSWLAWILDVLTHPNESAVNGDGSNPGKALDADDPGETEITNYGSYIFWTV